MSLRDLFRGAQPDPDETAVPVPEALLAAAARLPPELRAVLRKALAPERADRYDSAARLQRYAGPILVLRAAEDDLVRPARTDALLASLKGKAVESLTLPDSNHYDILQARGLWPAIREFVSGAKMDSP